MSQKRNILNLIFFARQFEPLPGLEHLDLPGTMQKQIDLVNRYGFKASFYCSMMRLWMMSTIAW